MDRDALHRWIDENFESITEQEALEVLANPFCTTQLCRRIAQTPRLTGFHSIRERLVAHRLTPHGHSLKLVHYLYWSDLLRLSVDVKIPAVVRRAMENNLLNRLPKLTVGERVATARACSREVIKALLFDPDRKVFASLLINPRLVEDDLLALIGSERATVHQLQLIADDRKWSFRIAIRRALVLNPDTPRFAAASQLKYLGRRDLEQLMKNPETSTYLKRCIERLDEQRAQRDRSNPS